MTVEYVDCQPHSQATVGGSVLGLGLTFVMHELDLSTVVLCCVGGW